MTGDLLLTPEAPLLLSAGAFLALAASSGLQAWMSRCRRAAADRAVPPETPEPLRPAAAVAPVTPAPLDTPQKASPLDQPPDQIAWLTAQRAKRRFVRREVAVMQFLEFLRERNNTGWFAAEHIDDLWAWFCEVNGVSEMDPRLIRAELAAMPACRHGQKRLNGPEFIELRTALGRDRAYVYYIPPKSKPLPSRPVSGSEPSHAGGVQAAGRQAAGRRPANPKKRVLSTTFDLSEAA